MKRSPSNKKHYEKNESITKTRNRVICLRFGSELSCSIFPLCGGGCIQKQSESEDNNCLFDVDSKKINTIILDRFYQHIVKSKINP